MMGGIFPLKSRCLDQEGAAMAAGITSPVPWCSPAEKGEIPSISIASTDRLQVSNFSKPPKISRFPTLPGFQDVKKMIIPQDFQVSNFCILSFAYSFTFEHVRKNN